MKNQTTNTTPFSAFGTPEKIFMDGEDITTEVVEKFGGVDAWLRRLVTAFNDLRVTAFTITRIGDKVELHVSRFIKKAEK